jgi:hypothetical protein
MDSIINLSLVGGRRAEEVGGVPMEEAARTTSVNWSLITIRGMLVPVMVTSTGLIS